MGFLDGQLGASMGPSRARPHGHLGALRFAVIALFGVLAIRLADMQIVNGSEYAVRARENHIRAVNLLPPRGLIFDRNGTLLVNNEPVFAATVVPEFLPESQEGRRTIYLWLESHLGVPALQVQELVRAAEADGLEDRAIRVKSHLDKKEALALEENAAFLPGVSLTLTAGRRYVGGEALSHVLGFTGAQTREEYLQLRKDGYQLDEQIGKAGVESRYERDLRGQPGISANEVDAAGHVLNALQTREPVPGHSLRLSIDADLQQYVSDILDASRAEASVAAAVVMNARTGEVYALVSYPGYDNNIFGDDDRDQEFRALLEDPRKPLLNQALTPSAPGSTFKLVTAAAALQTGNITPGTTRTISSTVLEVTGENGQIYPLYDWRAHGTVDLAGAIAWSSNIYFYMASCGILKEVRGLGKDPEESAVRLGYYARALGFGQATGIDIDAAEANGVVPSPEWKQRAHSGPEFNPEDREWYYADTCFMGIGQGDVLATPLQIARMTAAIANGGKLVTPHVVREVLDERGRIVRTIEPETKDVPVDQRNLAAIREGMRESVGYGAGAAARASVVEVAGKTGTAEFGPVLGNGKRAEHAWFTGFAPFDNPEIVVTVYFDLGVGGAKAAPVAGKIIEYYWEHVR